MPIALNESNPVRIGGNRLRDDSVAQNALDALGSCRD